MARVRGPPVVSVFPPPDCLVAGTYGVVKLGVHLVTNQQVAVKILDHTLASAVAREVETWRHLRHPHIAQLYEVLHSENKIYLVRSFLLFAGAFSRRFPPI